MRLVALLGVLAAGCTAVGQVSFSGALEEGDKWWGRIDLEVSKDKDAIWTFTCYDRQKFMWMLGNVHGNDRLSLDVTWGKHDVLRVNAGPIEPRFLEDDGYERLLRSMLIVLEMTYRIEAGSYKIVRRPSHEYLPQDPVRPKLEQGKSGAFSVAAKGVQSLDLLAEVLALKGITYSVARGLKCSRVDVDLKGASLKDLVSFIERAEPGLSIEVGERSVAVSPRKRSN